MTIGDRLKMARSKVGLSQSEISDELNISKSAWAMYERNERVPRDEIKVRIANMTAEKLAQYTASKYGKPLCAECAQKSADDKRKNTVANPLDAESKNDTPEESFTVIDDADE